MFKRTIIVFVFLASIVNGTVFSQAVTGDSAASNDAREIPEQVPPESEADGAESVSALHEDYTIAERLGIGALNIFGGAGSITIGKRTGWLVTGIQGIGLLSVLGGVIYGIVGVPPPPPAPGPIPNDVPGGEAVDDQYRNVRYGLITAGSVAIGTGVVVGFIIPFFHHRTDNANGTGGGYVAQSDFPLNLELVSSNGQDISGFSISYKMSF